MCPVPQYAFFFGWTRRHERQRIQYCFYCGATTFPKLSACVSPQASPTRCNTKPNKCFPPTLMQESSSVAIIQSVLFLKLKVCVSSSLSLSLCLFLSPFVSVSLFLSLFLSSPLLTSSVPPNSPPLTPDIHEHYWFLKLLLTWIQETFNGKQCVYSSLFSLLGYWFFVQPRLTGIQESPASDQWKTIWYEGETETIPWFNKGCYKGIINVSLSQ